MKWHWDASIHTSDKDEQREETEKANYTLIVRMV